MTNTKLWYPWKNPSLAIALQSLKITAEVAKAREKIPNCKFRMTTEGWAPVLTNISKKTPANPEEKQATSTAIRPENKIGQIYSSNWSKLFFQARVTWSLTEIIKAMYKKTRFSYL